MFKDIFLARPVLLILLTALVLMPACGSPASRSSSGRLLAPDFTLNTLGGDAVTLSALRGQPVLLNFWATWCPPCRQEMPLIQAIYEENRGNDLQIIAVDIGEDFATVKKFIEEEKLGFTVALDYKKQVSQSYGVQAIPTSFFIDRDGKIAHTKIGAFHSRAEIRNFLERIK